MSNHHVSITGFIENRTWQAICTCRRVSPILDQKWEAEDWRDQHHEEIDRIRSRIDRPMSLRALRDFYLSRAATTTDGDAALWQQLADELDRRIERPRDAGSDEQARLW